MDRKAIARAVSLTAWGYLLLYLNFNIVTVDILPNWLGYVLILKGIGTLGQEAPTLKLLRPLGILLGVWEGAVWVLTAIGFGWDHYLCYLIRLVVAVLEIYFHFQFLTDLAGIAARVSSAHQRKLLRLRTVRTVLATVVALPIRWTENSVLAVALVVVGAVVGLWLCVVLFGLKKAIEQGPTPEEV